MGVHYYAFDAASKRAVHLGKCYWLDCGDWTADGILAAVSADGPPSPREAALAERIAQWAESAEGPVFVASENWQGRDYGDHYIPGPDCIGTDCYCEHGSYPCDRDGWTMEDDLTGALAPRWAG